MIPASAKAIKASVVAAVHLLSLELAGDAPLPTTAAEAIGLANAGRNQAYAMLGRLRQGAESLARPAGRPAMPSPDGPTLAKLSAAVLAFVMAHPGCCNTTNETRAYYHGSFRRFVVGLFAPGCPAAEKQWILELRRREQTARTSRERRTDPIRRQLLEKKLQRLGIEDPKGRISLSLARYSMNAILTGLSIFDAKLAQGSLPKDCQPERYLGGIIRNCEDSQLLESMGRKLLDLRLSVADAQIVPLSAEAAKISAAANDPCQRTRTFVDHALDADSTLAFRFWCLQAIKAISHMPSSDIPALCVHFRRVIAAAFRVDIRRRQQLLADLLAEAVPVVA